VDTVTTLRKWLPRGQTRHRAAGQLAAADTLAAVMGAVATAEVEGAVGTEQSLRRLLRE